MNLLRSRFHVFKDLQHLAVCLIADRQLLHPPAWAGRRFAAAVALSSFQQLTNQANIPLFLRPGQYQTAAFSRLIVWHRHSACALLSPDASFAVNAVKDLGLPLVSLSGAVETAGFWDGIHVTQGGPNWLQQAAVVVQPAFIENAPRPLLRALAADIPVIATTECGITERPGLSLVPSGDALAIRKAITERLAGAGVPRRVAVEHA